MYIKTALHLRAGRQWFRMRCGAHTCARDKNGPSHADTHLPFEVCTLRYLRVLFRSGSAGRAVEEKQRACRDGKFVSEAAK